MYYPTRALETGIGMERSRGHSSGVLKLRFDVEITICFSLVEAGSEGSAYRGDAEICRDGSWMSCMHTDTVHK